MSRGRRYSVGPWILLLSWMCVSLLGCDNKLEMRDGQFRGYGMSFDLPEGYVDMLNHPDEGRSAEARQLRRMGGVTAFKEGGEPLNSLISLLPVVSADRLEVDEELCRQLARDTTRRFEPRLRQLGLRGRVEYSELASPGGIPDTDCAFLISLGDGAFFALLIVFEYGDTVFLTSCEAETRDEAFRLCDDMFESWRRS